jgi:hypothetical protein
LKPIFLDTEFSGLHQSASLLSLALVPDEGLWFYAVFTEVDRDSLSPWHQEHVVPHLELTPAQLDQLGSGQYHQGSKKEIVAALQNYLSTFEEVVIWADVPAYDWVLFCELFGGALSLPKNIHYIVRDLATLFEVKGFDVDTDRFAFAWGEAAGAGSISADGRTEGQAAAKTAEGLLRHNALGDAIAGMICWRKMAKG